MAKVLTSSTGRLVPPVPPCVNPRSEQLHEGRGAWHLGFASRAHTPNARGFNSFFGFFAGYGRADFAFRPSLNTFPNIRSMCYKLPTYRGQSGPSKGRESDPRIYQLTDCKSTLGFGV
jgi:hypothetical protein